MSLFSKIGGFISECLDNYISDRTPSATADGSSDPKSARKSESPIQKMHRRQKEKYGVLPADIESQFSDEMSEEEQQEAMKKLFPLGSHPFVQTSDSTAAAGSSHSTTVLSPSYDPALGTPTMDAAGTVVPKNGYPAANGRNVAVESGGLGLMQDPLMRFPINPRVLKHFQSRIWITYNGCALISTHEFVNRACTIPAEDAIAHGYKVVCSSHSHEHNDTHDANEARFLYDVKVEADKMGLNEVCVKLNFNKKVFGVAIAIPRVEFKEDAKSPSDENKPYSYADPYDPNMIKPGSYKGFAVVDPIWLTYEFDDESANDPISPHFYEPTWVHTRTRRIHRSWMIRVCNSFVPDILKPQYYFGGLSLTQMIYERVWCADKLANEAPLLAMTKRLLIADGNLEQLISDPRHTNVFFKAINYFRDNFSIFVKKPSSNVTQLDTSLADLTPLTMAEYQLMAAIAQIPVTKLLKNVPSGLQATGEYEWDDYAQSLIGIQKGDYTPILRMHYDLYCHSNYPDRHDIDLDIEWNPIDVPKETEVTQMTSQSAQYVATLMGNGVVTVGEARSMLRRSNLPAYQAVAPEVPEILKKLEDAKDPEKQAQMGGGMMPGGIPGGEPPPDGGGDGGGAPAQQTDPVVAQNEKAFKDAVQYVLHGDQADGGGTGDGQQQDQPPADGQDGQTPPPPQAGLAAAPADNKGGDENQDNGNKSAEQIVKDKTSSNG